MGQLDSNYRPWFIFVVILIVTHHHSFFIYTCGFFSKYLQILLFNSIILFIEFKIRIEIINKNNIYLIDIGLLKEWPKYTMIWFIIAKYYYFYKK